MDLVEEIYKITKEFPDSEKFGLTSQMRRASISIPSNIAEGSRRSGKKEYRHFLLTAYGSGSELETQILLAKRLNICKLEEFFKVDGLLDEILRMLNSLQSKLRQ